MEAPGDDAPRSALDARHRRRRHVALVVSMGAVLRIAWAIFAVRPLAYLFGGDPNSYVRYARSLANGDGYPSLVYDGPGAFHPPGWSLILSVWYVATDALHVPGDDFDHAAVLTVVFGTATVLLVYLVARRVFDHGIAITAAAVFALWPNVVFYTGVPALETAFMFFWMLACWLVLRCGWPATPLTITRALPAGAALGVSMLIRPFSMVLVPALFVAVLVGHSGWRRAARDACLVGVIGVALVLPWTVRNAIQLDGFVPVSTNMGETFCLGHHPGASGGFVDVPDYCTHPYEILHEPTDDIARNRVGFEQGLRFALRHPGTEVRLLAKKAWYIARDDHDALDAVESNGADPFIDERARDLLRWVADIAYYLIVLATAVGVGQFVRGRDARRWLVLLTAVGLLAFPLGLYGLARFKLPLAPFLAIAAGAGAVRLWRMSKGRSARLTPATTPAIDPSATTPVTPA